jgi:hypothetical protein
LSAIEEAWRLAPNEGEVLRLVAFRALLQRAWPEAHALALKAWLRGADGVPDRVTLALSARQLGQCAEVRSWTPQAAADQDRFRDELVRLQAILSTGNPCP